jgi:hypothetical protein
MIVIFGFIFGALLGSFRARRRNGSGFDIAQYAVAHAIFFALLGLFVTIAIDRLL